MDKVAPSSAKLPLNRAICIDVSGAKPLAVPCTFGQYPNGIGTFGVDGIDNESGNGLIWSPWGAFYLLDREYDSAVYTPTSKKSIKGIGFDLSKSNSVFSGRKVQPRSYQLLMIIKA